MHKFEVLLFDLGGVLIELPGLPVSSRWSGLDDKETWRRWSLSASVREFESGRTTPAAFAAGIVSEFGLNATPDEFISEFVDWPGGLIAGTTDLLSCLRNDFHLACLSNTNHLHWERFHRETDLFDLLHSAFASHMIGIMKPTPGIYEHVIAELGVAPEHILFFDDNRVNVEAAEALGMTARLTRGVEGIRASLRDLGVAEL